MLDWTTDKTGYMGWNTVFLVPEQPLAADTTYVAHIAGTDMEGVSFDHRWAFSTGDKVAAPDFATTQAWAEPLLPKQGETITYHMRLVNSGLRAETVTVHAALPEATNYVKDSALTSQGSVTGEGPLEFTLGAVPAGSTVEIQFSVIVSQDASLPKMLKSHMRVDWEMGRVERTAIAHAEAKPIFLPAIMALAN